MLSYLRTSILKSDAQTVVNTVNTVGVMGKGLAAEFRSRYPEMFSRYREICANQLLEPGKLWLWKGPSQWVLNFPTKRHWRNPSRIEYIEAGLRKFAETFEERGITDIAFPRLGCGNGGLKWEDVKPLMERYLRPLPIQVFVHDHQVELGQPEHLEIELAAFRQHSFSQFVRDLEALLKRKENFVTISNGSKFKVSKRDEALLLLRGEGSREIAISEDELREIWVVLSKGILTRRKMSGKLYDEAYYLMPLLAGLPYVRAVEIERKGGVPTIGLEMLKRSGISTDQLLGQHELSN